MAGGEFLGNMLMNLLAPVSSAPQFTGGYQPAQPGNPQTPQDFTNYSGPRIDPGSPQMDPRAASYQPLQPNPDVVNTFAARLRGLGPQLAAQAALYNQQFGNQQMQSQNQWANSQGVNPTDPNLGTLNGPALARALSQAQAGTLQAQSGGLEAILSGLTTAGAIPYANNIGSSRAINTVSGNVAQGLGSQNAAIKAATLQPSAASSALLENTAQDTGNQAQAAVNRFNTTQTQARQPWAAQTGDLQGASQLSLLNANLAQSNLGALDATQQQGALEQYPESALSLLKSRVLGSLNQANAAGRTTMFPGGSATIFGADNVPTGYVNDQLPQINNPALAPFQKQIVSPNYTPAPTRVSLSPYVPSVDPSVYTGQPTTAGSAVVPGGVGTNVAEPIQQDLMDQFKQMTPTQRRRLIEQIQATKTEGVPSANSLLFNPQNSYMFQQRNSE